MSRLYLNKGSSIKDVRIKGRGFVKSGRLRTGGGLKANLDVRNIFKNCQIEENLLTKMFNNL